MILCILTDLCLASACVCERIQTSIGCSCYSPSYFIFSPQPREKGKMRIHKRQNVQVALMCLERHKVKLVGITSDHIVDGNKKLILGLVWTLILHFQLSSGGDDKVDQREVKRELLQWAQTAVEP